MLTVMLLESEVRQRIGLVLQREVSLNVLDNVHSHVTGTEGHTIKKLDWFSRKDVTEFSR